MAIKEAFTRITVTTVIWKSMNRRYRAIARLAINFSFDYFDSVVLVPVLYVSSRLAASRSVDFRRRDAL